ncbi:hypothetical protein N7468_006886 [Penicillium chermesinum]|uniref:Uncharacterized protein n=1 Tax=Penicillium chermesinum TaxID=63820 RepID=A0A9W9NT28_9EURO|nr:uncharacterized protein N7468_006886 [Penicillium chermesinum]KAJ5225661.1 hypothetical protein N7468_006886 [Penicillium chermesinum]KAJ6161120.1 hypothetical protein N7470_004516 [Penicillium chermesinum]
MPKKHKRVYEVKPAGTPHHSLSTNRGPRNGQNGSSETRSVNDLISHLRRTQIASNSDTPQIPSSPLIPVQRSVHPALRHHLSLPDSPQPRPQRNGTPIGERPRRVAPGPRAPESWLTARDHNAEIAMRAVDETTSRTRMGHIHRFPGARSLGPSSLTHQMLKQLSENWPKMKEEYGVYLSLLPNHLKALLFSYLCQYSPANSCWHETLNPFYPLLISRETAYATKKHDPEFPAEQCIFADSTFTRLDLSWAIEHGVSLAQLHSQLALQQPQTHSSADIVPESWDEIPAGSGSIPSPLFPNNRFQELKYLFLAHPGKRVSWNSLLPVFQHIPKLTHLSLAYWPAPSGATPHGIFSSAVHPTNGWLADPTNGGWSDEQTRDAATLRELSRLTSCLEWLDLEGCTEWIRALAYTGIDPDGRPIHLDLVAQSGIGVGGR